MPKIEPTSKTIKQIIMIISTTIHPPAAIRAISPFMAKMAALTSAMVVKAANSANFPHGEVLFMVNWREGLDSVIVARFRGQVYDVTRGLS